MDAYLVTLRDEHQMLVDDLPTVRGFSLGCCRRRRRWWWCEGLNSLFRFRLNNVGVDGVTKMTTGIDERLDQRLHVDVHARACARVLVLLRCQMRVERTHYDDLVGGASMCDRLGERDFERQQRRRMAIGRRGSGGGGGRRRCRRDSAMSTRQIDATHQNHLTGAA